jgi:hypothetical protein
VLASEWKYVPVRRLYSLSRNTSFAAPVVRLRGKRPAALDTTSIPKSIAGGVNIIVNYAPLKPTEFVVIKIQQGQTEEKEPLTPQFSVSPRRFGLYNFKSRDVQRSVRRWARCCD